MKQFMTSSKKEEGTIRFDSSVLELTLPEGVSKIHAIRKLEGRVKGCLEKKKPYISTEKLYVYDNIGWKS